MDCEIHALLADYKSDVADWYGQCECCSMYRYPFYEDSADLDVGCDLKEKAPGEDLSASEHSDARWRVRVTTWKKAATRFEREKLECRMTWVHSADPGWMEKISWPCHRARIEKIYEECVNRAGDPHPTRAYLQRQHWLWYIHQDPEKWYSFPGRKIEYEDRMTSFLMLEAAVERNMHRSHLFLHVLKGYKQRAAGLDRGTKPFKVEWTRHPEALVQRLEQLSEKCAAPEVVAAAVHSLTKEHSSQLREFLLSLPVDVQFCVASLGPLPPEEAVCQADNWHAVALTNAHEEPQASYDYSDAPVSAQVHAVKAVSHRLREYLIYCSGTNRVTSSSQDREWISYLLESSNVRNERYRHPEERVEQLQRWSAALNNCAFHAYYANLSYAELREECQRRGLKRPRIDNSAAYVGALSLCDETWLQQARVHGLQYERSRLEQQELAW